MAAKNIDRKLTAIMFTDIVGFTSLMRADEKKALNLLYYNRQLLEPIIKKYNGEILKEMGDGTLNSFSSAIEAVRCAMEMREKLDEMNQKWNETEFSRYWKNHGIEKITARTGIHTGSVIAGNIGSNRMLQYSTIGDTVNVASRLEQRNKDFETEILFSQEIYTSLTSDLYGKAKYEGELNLKGRDTSTKAYSI